jgi:hypothetical protein
MSFRMGSRANIGRRIQQVDTLPSARYRRRGLAYGLLAAGFCLLFQLAMEGCVLAGTTTRSLARPDATTSSALLVLEGINAMRHDFGLPPAELLDIDHRDVTMAARNRTDPVLPVLHGGVVEEFGVWGIAPYDPPPSSGAIAAILSMWVYRDGWLGPATLNIDCTSPTAPDCNGHRRAILSPPPRAQAKLYLDIAVTQADDDGYPGISISVLMVWVRAENAYPLSFR